MSGRSRFPFTAAQWKELEHKAPVFKYMISGTPIPPDLLFSVKRNLYDCQEDGWSYSLLGMKKVDPEPGRCRITDGKKWRCSKEAYADSKYCVTHTCIEAKIVQESLWNSTPLTPAISSLIKISPSLSSNLPF